ncbi:MAG: patatin family protein [Coprococcus sp.]
MEKKGLVLEGGGIRGIYTAGVLDVFMENNITVDGVIGVSAGAIHGATYVANQPGRNIRYNLKYRNDKHYMSLYSLITTGDICGKDFCYRELPDELDPFDYEAFRNSPMRMYVGCSNLETGEAEYLECKDLKKPEDMDKLRASASLPLVSHIVEVDGKKLLDGGVSDSIPIFAFRRMGYRKDIVVLTRPEGYVKGEDKMLKLEAIKYKEYPEFVRRMYMRHRYYNKTIEKLAELEKSGEVLIIKPSIDMHISRLEKNLDKIQAMYELGVSDAQDKLQEVVEFLK